MGEKILSHLSSYRLAKWELPILLLFGSLILLGTRSFSEAQRSLVELGNLHKVISVAGSILIVAIVVFRSGFPRRIPPLLWLYSLYVLIAVVSVFQSPSRLYTIWKSAEIGAVLAVSFYVAKISAICPDAFERFYEKGLGFIKFLVVVTFLGILVNPTEALQPPISVESRIAYGDPVLPIRLSGVLIIINPNTLGAFGGILGIVAFVRILARQYVGRQFIWGGISLVLMALAQSRTAWMGFLCALMTIVLFHPAVSVKVKLAIYSCIGLALAASLSLIVAYLTRGMDSERLLMLSGRSIWWALAIAHVQSLGIFQQMFGGGFMAANRTFLAEAMDLDETASLHSDYVDALVSVGYVGVLVLLVFVVALGVKLLICAKNRTLGPIGAEAFGIYVILLVRSITGTTFASHTVFLILALAIAGLVAGRGENMRYRESASDP